MPSFFFCMSDMRSSSPFLVLGGALTLGFLWPFRVNPIPSFSGEWLVGMGVVLTLLATLHQRAIVIRWPRIVAGFLPLMLIILLQWMSGRFAYPEHAVFGLLFLLTGVLTATIVSSLKGTDSESNERAALFLHSFLMASAVLSACTALAQWLGWDRFLSPFVFPMEAVAQRGRPTGNIAQPNLLATLCGLGMVSVGWLGLQKKLPAWGASSSALFLAFAIGLTGSRTALLFVPCLMLALVWYLLQSETAQRRHWLGVLLPLAIVVAHFAVPFLSPLLGSTLISTEVRGLNLSSDSRMQLWSIGLHSVTNTPWLGHGVGTFIEYMGFSAADLGLKDTGVAHHTHNLFLQLVLDFGWPGMVSVLLISTIYVWKKKLLVSPSLTRISAWSVIAVLLVHSQLEFPLWYLHFWLVFVWAMVLVDVEGIPIPAERIVRAALLGVVVLGLSFGTWLYRDYWETHRRVQALFSPVQQVPSEVQGDIRAWSLFTSSDEYVYHMLGALPLPLDARDLELRRRTTERQPAPAALIRLAVIEVLAGQPDRAKRYLDVLKATEPTYVGLIRPEFDAACQAFQTKSVCDFGKQLR